MRPTRDRFYLEMAHLAASRSTCARRRVGCVAVNERGHLIALGYNGAPPGWNHCIDCPCPGAQAAPGTGLDLCEAIHAEINMLAQCRDVWEIHTVYATASPCVSCVKSLLASGCQRLVFLSVYPHDIAEQYWTRANRRWELWTGEKL